MKKEDIKPRDENGYPHGYCELYFTNDDLFRKGYYIHGQRYGYFEEYRFIDNIHELSYKGCFFDNRIIGLMLFYNFSGKIGRAEYSCNTHSESFDLFITSKNKIIF